MLAWRQRATSIAYHVCLRRGAWPLLACGVVRGAGLPEAPSASELPPLLIINWMIPNYPPGGLMASKRSDGPGWNLVIYCRLSAWVREALEQGGPLSPGVDLFRREVALEVWQQRGRDLPPHDLKGLCRLAIEDARREPNGNLVLCRRLLALERRLCSFLRRRGRGAAAVGPFCSLLRRWHG